VSPILENIWDLWIKMESLELFSRKKVYNEQHKHRRSRDQVEDVD